VRLAREAQAVGPRRPAAGERVAVPEREPRGEAVLGVDAAVRIGVDQVVDAVAVLVDGVVDFDFIFGRVEVDEVVEAVEVLVIEGLIGALLVPVDAEPREFGEVEALAG